MVECPPRYSSDTACSKEEQRGLLRIQIPHPSREEVGNTVWISRGKTKTCVSNPAFLASSLQHPRGGRRDRKEPSLGKGQR